jgi:hypothetical protein
MNSANSAVSTRPVQIIGVAFMVPSACGGYSVEKKDSTLGRLRREASDTGG